MGGQLLIAKDIGIFAIYLYKYSCYLLNLGKKPSYSKIRDDYRTNFIVQRGGAMIMLKSIGVEPVPNYTRDIKKGIARWDAYLHVPDPDALSVEFASRDVVFFRSIKDSENGDDGLRRFEIEDADGYILFFGRTQES